MFNNKVWQCWSAIKGNILKLSDKLFFWHKLFNRNDSSMTFVSYMIQFNFKWLRWIFWRISKFRLHNNTFHNFFFLLCWAKWKFAALPRKESFYWSSLFTISHQNIECSNLFSICGYQNVTCVDKFSFFFTTTYPSLPQLTKLFHCTFALKTKSDFFAREEEFYCSGNSADAILWGN